MTLAALFMIYAVLTGLWLAYTDVTDSHQTWAGMGGGPGAHLNDDAIHARAVPDPASLASGISQALATAGNLPIASVDYRLTSAPGNIPRLELAEANGDRDRELRFYAAIGTTMTQQVADSDAFGPMPAYAERREFIKALHKGNQFGLAGQLLGLVTGCALLVMLASGVTLYLRTWAARRKAGKSAFFWQARESRWRSWHRGVAIIAAIFVLNKVVTGTILAWGEIQVQLALHHVLPFPYPRPTPLPPYAEERLTGDPLQGLKTSYDAAKAAAPGVPIVAVQLVGRDHLSKGLVTLGGDQPRTLAFDMHTGAPVDDWALRGVQRGNGYFADWHQVLKRMHRGDIIGHFGGRYGDITVGLSLLYLVGSGSVLYVQMLRRRKSVGQSGLFWK